MTSKFLFLEQTSSQNSRPINPTVYLKLCFIILRVFSNSVYPNLVIFWGPDPIERCRDAQESPFQPSLSILCSQSITESKGFYLLITFQFHLIFSITIITCLLSITGTLALELLLGLPASALAFLWWVRQIKKWLLHSTNSIISPCLELLKGFPLSSG